MQFESSAKLRGAQRSLTFVTRYNGKIDLLQDDLVLAFVRCGELEKIKRDGNFGRGDLPNEVRPQPAAKQREPSNETSRGGRQMVSMCGAKETSVLSMSSAMSLKPAGG